LDNTARLWDTTTGEPAGPALQHRAGVFSVAFSPDGRSVLTASDDHTCRLWDAVTGEAVGPPLVHEQAVWAVAVDPAGKTFLTGSDDASARLWPMPAVLEGEVDRLRMWSEVVTGTELDRVDGLRVLDEPAWQSRRQKLQEMGGPPSF
jgi:WD40 repeat protein